jgi:hypothetical protein
VRAPIPDHVFFPSSVCSFPFLLSSFIALISQGLFQFSFDRNPLRPSGSVPVTFLQGLSTRRVPVCVSAAFMIEVRVLPGSPRHACSSCSYSMPLCLYCFGRCSLRVSPPPAAS